MPRQDRQPGRLVAWAALALGVSMSIAANALHVTLVTGETTGETSMAQVIGAAFWPVALLLAIEVMARVTWPEGAMFALLRWGGVGAVALVAAIVSYGHMHDLLLHWGESKLTALLGPIGVDGLVTVGAVALMAISQPPTEPAPTAQVAAQPEPTPAEQTPTQPAQAQAPALSEPDRPGRVGSSIDVAAMKRAGLPAGMAARVEETLQAVLADGRTPAPHDLAGTGLPAAFAAKVITAGINGHATQEVST